MTRRSRRAKPRGLIGLSLLLVSGVLVSQSPNASPPTKAIYANRALAFRYTPPGGMRDKTSRFQLQIQDPLLASGMPQRLGMLLAMSSGPDSDVPFWRSVTIVTYPRSAVSEPDDAKAEAQMSAWVAHSKDASALPRSVVISERVSLCPSSGCKRERSRRARSCGPPPQGKAPVVRLRRKLSRTVG